MSLLLVILNDACQRLGPFRRHVRTWQYVSCPSSNRYNTGTVYVAVSHLIGISKEAFRSLDLLSLSHLETVSLRFLPLSILVNVTTVYLPVKPQETLSHVAANFNTIWGYPLFVSRTNARPIASVSQENYIGASSRSCFEIGRGGLGLTLSTIPYARFGIGMQASFRKCP